jgi:hypothetical protein
MNTPSCPNSKKGSDLMRKVISTIALLAAIIILGVTLVACTGDKPPTPSPTQPPAVEPDQPGSGSSSVESGFHNERFEQIIPPKANLVISGEERGTRITSIEGNQLTVDGWYTITIPADYPGTIPPIEKLLVLFEYRDYDDGDLYLYGWQTFD